MIMNARSLVELLKAKHAEDIFLTECKNGGSAHGHLRLDGWAMKKSWAGPLTTGYEIKVSRSDFLGDNKWQGYLPCCNELYFVSPFGLIQPNEVPEKVGLLWASKTGTKLYVKKKAVYRTDGLKLEDVYKYILLWRSTVSDNVLRFTEIPNKEFWQNWLKEKDEDKRLGYIVSSKIKKLLDERIFKVEQENNSLRDENEKLKDIKDKLKILGFDNVVPSKWSFDQQLKNMRAIIPDDMKRSLVNLDSGIKNSLSKIEQMEHENLQ
jgi:hypothetical protein